MTTARRRVSLPRACVLGAALLLCACAPPFPAPGSPPPEATPISWDIQGILRQVGSFPHVEMVVTGRSEPFGQGDYYVTGSLRKEISALPLGRIKVRGRVSRREIALAGTSGGKRIRLEIDVAAYER